MHDWYLIQTNVPFVIAPTYTIIDQGSYERMKRMCDKCNKKHSGLQNPEYYYTVRQIKKL